MTKLVLLKTASILLHSCLMANAFFQTVVPTPKRRQHRSSSRDFFPGALSISLSSLSSSLSSNSAATDANSVESKVAQLKKVLRREYITFFDPMERDYYAEQVTFDDPMTSLAGVDSYQNNVDMLAARTLMGKFLFQDAGINLHSVTGGEVTTLKDGTVAVADITTRWTLRMCVKILPWQPVPRFSGISVYKVAASGPKGVQVLKQTDYWDSINLKPGGKYEIVDKSIAVKDFLDQLKPDEFNAAQAAPELPFELLRRGNDYEVRRYPSYTAVKTLYERRDEGFSVLGAFTSGACQCTL